MTEQRPPIYPGEWLSESQWLDRQAVGLQKAQKPFVVTGEMIEAGKCALARHAAKSFEGGSPEMCSSIYLAMRALEPKG